jgi:probable F420-dependent oxidoreductase
MKFGIAFANTGPFVDPGGAVAFALAAEAAGFESLWTVEHVVVPAGYESPYPYSQTGRMPGREDAPIPDPVVWLTYLAGATTSIRLATGILILPQREPVVLAKELATLDHLSRGRLELGVGIGWLREEFDAIGVPFAERARRTDEAVAAMRALWAEPVASFSGEFFRFDGCISRPQPASGSIPVHIGGHTEAAARRAGRIGDGLFPASGTHAELGHLFKIARQTAEQSGRDPERIEFTTGGNGAVGERALDEIGELAALGVSRVIVPSFLFYKDPEASLARYGEDVIAASR